MYISINKIRDGQQFTAISKRNEVRIIQYDKHRVEIIP